MNEFRVLLFDLDDTLLDTTGQLVKEALKEACQKMIEGGLDASLEKCILSREEFLKTNPRENPFHLLVERYNPNSAKKEEIINVGKKAFYQREIKEDLKLFPGVEEMLKSLKENYILYLVSAGDPKTQMQKIKILGLEAYFHEIYFVNPIKKETKEDCFSKILKNHSFSPQSYLSIGNRIDKEIREAKNLGMKTCLFQHGEHFSRKPEEKNEFPDFQITKICDLIATCRL